MKTEIKKLKELGANVQEVEGGLKLIGNWKVKYNEFHNLFIEITGKLDTSNSVQHPGFLKNLNSLGDLDTNDAVQHPDFLKNLTSLGVLYTYNSVQHPDFLKNLSSLGVLYTSNSVQHPDFLKNLTSLGLLYTTNSAQQPDFLKNLTTLDGLNTSYSLQHPDFLKNLSSLGELDTSNSVQHPDFLKNLSVLGMLDTSNSVQHPDFLKNLSSLGVLYTSNSVQHPDFLKNLTSLGKLYTYMSAQDSDFLKNVKRTFELPFLYKDNILSFVHSTKVIDGITIHKTNRIGYTESEYVAIKGELSAHADTLKLALIDLRFKESNRDTSWLEDKTLESILSFEDSVLAYRCITGACSGGVSHFLKTIKEQKEYKISEIIELTKNEYRNKEFTSFFNKN
jgi:hypothetical protein